LKIFSSPQGLKNLPRAGTLCGIQLEGHENSVEILLLRDETEAENFSAPGQRGPVIMWTSRFQPGPPWQGLIYSHIDRIKKDRIIIIATNEPEEAALCGRRIELAGEIIETL
jgi:hypothetical protein